MRAKRSGANPNSDGWWATSSDMFSVHHMVVVAVGAECLSDRTCRRLQREAVDAAGRVREVELRHVVGGNDVDVSVRNLVAGDDDAHPRRIECTLLRRADRLL